jgi:bifunctional UDP-N-acetylglucosamine pyrophosphorylase/glucosamine-1-phosphate N-acetyltransferase
MKAVILAAGKGTRLHPLTLTRPKHLVPIGGKPIIDHVLTSLDQAGFNEVVFIVNYLSKQLKAHLGDGSKYKMQFTFTTQEQLKGTADAASYAKPHVEDTFLLTYGDWLMTTDAVKKILRVHEQETPLITMAVVPVVNPEQYGIIELDGSSIKRIIEKPRRNDAPTNLANAGIYILADEIFQAIERTQESPRSELEITDSLSLLIEEDKKIAAAKLSSNELFDVGLLWDLFNANQWALDKLKPTRKGQIEDNTHLIGAVGIGEGARIRSGTYIEGPAIIGRESDIGPNCYIRPHTSIGQNVRIGNSCEIKNSLIMDKTHIGHLSYIGDSIIGENCNFGAGTTIANYRFDGKPVKIKVKNDILNSRRRKFGAVFGDSVKTGINSLFMPGVKVGNDCWIGPNVNIARDIPPKTKIILKQHIEVSTRP